MTNLKRRNKILFIMSLVFALCLTLIFSVVPAGASSDVIITAKELFPAELRGTEVTPSETSAYVINNQVTTNSTGIVFTNTLAPHSGEQYTHKFSYQYFKTLKTIDFSLDILFESSWQEGDSLRLSLTIVGGTHNGSYIEWIFYKSGSDILAKISQSVGGAAPEETQAKIIPSGTSATIGIALVTSWYDARIISGGNTIESFPINGVIKDGIANFSVEHEVKTAEAQKSFKTTLRELCGASLTQGTTAAGIVDRAVPTAKVDFESATYVSYNETTKVIRFKTGETGGVANVLRFNISAYDIFAYEDEMKIFVEDTFGGKTYLPCKTAFSSTYEYNPLVEYPNVLPIGTHTLTVGVQKSNGQESFQAFTVEVLTPNGDLEVRPTISTGALPSTIEYFTPATTTVPSFSAVDCLGEDCSVTLKITAPDGKIVTLDENKQFNPELLGEYIFTYEATDKYGNKRKEERTVMSVKTSLPASSGANLLTSTIYYRENTYNYYDYEAGKCIYTAADAAEHLFTDVDGGRNLTVTVLVHYKPSGTGNWVVAAESHSFVPVANVPYQITYIAKDLAGHTVSRTFALTVENRIAAPEFNLDGFIFEPTFVYRPGSTRSVTAEDIRNYLVDFDAASCNLSLEIKKYNASNNLVNIDSGEYNAGQFAPNLKDGRYLFTFRAENSAGKTASASYTLTVYSHKPVFNSGLSTFEAAFPSKIEYLKSNILPEMRTNYVTDGYDSTITISVSIFNPSGQNVTNLYSETTRMFAPASEGWHTVTYTAENIAGNKVSISYMINAVAYAPEFVNVNNFAMPESARFYKGTYTAARETHIPKLTTDYISDYYDNTKVSISLVVYKYNAAGQPVTANSAEYVVSGTDVDYDLFRPAQTGLYTFVYTATNAALKTATLTLSITVIAFAPQLVRVDEFKALMPETCLYYVNYSGATLTPFPEFNKAIYVVDDDMSTVSIDLVIKRPNGDLATKGTTASAEFNESDRRFRPLVTGQYTFTYVISNGAGESVSVSYGVLVFAHKPEILKTFTIPSSAKYGKETEIPLLTAAFITDAYNSIAVPVIPEIRNKFDQYPQGVPVDNQYTQGLGTGGALVGKFKPTAKGLYTFTYTITNAGGQTATIVFNVYVTMEAPTVIFKVNNTPVSDYWEKYKIVEFGEPFIIPTAEAKDEMGTAITGGNFTATFKASGSAESSALSTTQHTVNFSTVGTYVFTYKAIDSTGNETIVVYTVKCEDSIDPHIVVNDSFMPEYFTFMEYDADNTSHNITLRRYGSEMGWYAYDPSTSSGTDNKGSGVELTKCVVLILCPKYPETGWPANAQGNFVIPLVRENEGIYTVIYSTEDKAGNRATRYFTFNIKNPPTIVRPALPSEQMGNSIMAIPVPILFNDWAGSGFKIYCLVTDPEEVVTEIDLTGGSKNLLFEKPGTYELTYYARNAQGILSNSETFKIDSLTGNPTFTEETRNALYSEIARLSSSGISMNTWYNLPMLVARDAFGLGSLYEVVLFVEHTNPDGSQKLRYDPMQTNIDGVPTMVFRVMFRDEAIYKLSFYCYNIYTGEVVLDDLGNPIVLTDTLRVSGSGEISFRYEGAVFPGFIEYDSRYSWTINRDGVLDFTKYVMPSVAPGTGRVFCDIKFRPVTAQGRINGKDTYPDVMIYVFGPGSTIEEEGLRFMDALEVKVGGGWPVFRAYEIGWYTIIYEAKDENGNVLRIQYKLKVVDETAPVFSDAEAVEKTLRDITKNAEVTKAIALPIPRVSDNYDKSGELVVTALVVCPNDTTIMLSIEEGFSFTPSFAGAHTVIYTVTDLTGNFYTLEMTAFEVIPEVPSQTPILGIALGGVAGLIVMAGAVYLIVYKNVFKVKKLIPTNQ